MLNIDGIKWCTGDEICDLLDDRFIHGPVDIRRIVKEDLPFYPGYKRTLKEAIKIAQKEGYDLFKTDGGTWINLDMSLLGGTQTTIYTFYRFNKPKTHPYRGIIAEK